jgi:hypothetical protein
VLVALSGGGDHQPVTFDLLAWTARSWLLALALRSGGPVWLVAGAGLENKTLLAFYSPR